MNELDRLHADIAAVRDGTKAAEKTRKLLTSGRTKIAKKVGEEGVEVALAAMAGRDRKALVIGESADLLYNLTVLWAHLEVAPAEVWAELERRRVAFGLAEKPGS